MPAQAALTIGIDCRFIHDRLDGIGRYISQLVAGLCAVEGGHRIVAFVDAGRRLPDAIAPASAKLHSHAIPIPVFHPRGLWAWRSILREQPIDLFHAPYHVWAPAQLPCPMITTVHDLIFDRYPQYMPHGYTWPAYKIMSAHAISHSSHILTVSQATQRDIARFHRADARKITVTPLGADARFTSAIDARRREQVRERYRLPKAYALAFGTRRLHKNTRRLIEAFARIAHDVPHTLVLVGSAKAAERWPSPALAALRRSGRLIELEYIADADLPALYALADLFVQPSIIEGFGLPVIEAMACGCPVACSNTSSLPEVAGDAALLFDPFSTQDLAAALGRALSSFDLRRELSQRGLRRAGMFMWERALAETLSVYRACATNCRGVL
jgi:glycosyltransferase involved in cell wall biosynthesis